MDTMEIDTTNGHLSPHHYPDTHSLSPQHLSSKRKREDSSIPPNGKLSTNGMPVPGQSLREMISDLVTVLQSQDKHAILSRQIVVRDSSEPQAKRQKAESESSSIPTSITIRSRAASDEYKSTNEFISDVEQAADAVSKDLQLPQGSLRNNHLPLSQREVEIFIDIESFKKTAKDLVEREEMFSKLRAPERPNGVSTTDKTIANGASKRKAQLTTKGDGKVVLTIYGNAAGNKQLFSSLQASVHNTGISPPLREVSLPEGISTTHIVPAKPVDLADEKKRIPTFGELFTASNTLPLQPPKPSRSTATRSSSVGWYNPSSLENTKPRSSSYFGQPVSTGQWLEYNSASKSPESKRKQRDRALSLSGKPPPSESNDEEDDVKQLESLFRSAYSGFAPTKDDSAAVAPEGTVNRIWWQNVGEKSYERFLRNIDHLDGLDSDPKVPELDPFVVNTDEPKDEFDTWVPADAIDPSLQDTPAPKSIEEKESDEILKDISELLETLNSYQRIRNLSLNQPTRPTGSLASTDPTAIVASTKPTESEQATYEILKAQLSLMISQLPPFAVAKLNSDQLAQLSISTRIPIETDDFKGVMEEDEFTARAKAALLPTGVRGVSTSYTRTPSATSLYGNQYGSGARTAAPGAYYQHTPVRQPSATMNSIPRTGITQPYNSQNQYTQRQPPSTGYRAPAAATPTYPHQAPRLPQSYGQSSTPATYFQQTPQTQPHYGQNMTSTTHSGMTHSTPQSVMNGRYQPTTHQNYQQRAPVSQSTMSYQYNVSNIPRQTSPQKPATNLYNSPQLQISQSQRSFSTSTPTPSIDPSRSYFQQRQGGLSNGTGTPTSQSYQRSHIATTSNNGVQNYVSAAGYATVMTEAEQGSILERNRRQLAQQQGSAQLAARAAALPSVMGNTGSAGNGTPGGLAALIEFNKSVAS